MKEKTRAKNSFEMLEKCPFFSLFIGLFAEVQLFKAEIKLYEFFSVLPDKP